MIVIITLSTAYVHGDSSNSYENNIEIKVVLITNLTHFFDVFISLLYMLRAIKCSSSGESIVSIHRVVYITLRRWPTATYAE